LLPATFVLLLVAVPVACLLIYQLAGIWLGFGLRSCKYCWLLVAGGQMPYRPTPRGHLRLGQCPKFGTFYLLMASQSIYSCCKLIHPEIISILDNWNTWNKNVAFILMRHVNDVGGKKTFKFSFFSNTLILHLIQIGSSTILSTPNNNREILWRDRKL
jgi:hypothetical protein